MNNTLAHGFMLLEKLAMEGREGSVKELSAQTGLPPSHVCRLLKTLVETGYLEQDSSSRKYRVSLKLLSLSQRRLSNLDLRCVGHPFLARLGHDLNANVFLSAPCRGRSIIIDVVWPMDVVGDPSIVVGTVHNVCHSACGKVCAAFLEPEHRDMIQQAMAEETPPESLDDWSPEFCRIREAKLAVRKEAGIFAMAAPVFRAGNQFCGAVGVFFMAPAGKKAEVESVVRRCAHAISFALGQPYLD